MSGIWDQDEVIAALRFAAEAHAGQTIPGTAHPYVVHPAQVAVEVAAALAVEGADDPGLAMLCALLHDVVEDCGVTPAALEAEFGPAVAAGVSALSKNPALPKTEAMRDSLDRIRREPREVWMVKLADRISNLMPPPAYWDRARCAAYAAEAQLILDTLGRPAPCSASGWRQRSRLTRVTHSRSRGADGRTSRPPAVTLLTGNNGGSSGGRDATSICDRFDSSSNHDGEVRGRE